MFKPGAHLWSVAANFARSPAQAGRSNSLTLSNFIFGAVNLSGAFG
jgi:hypothetical protein